MQEPDGLRAVTLPEAIIGSKSRPVPWLSDEEFCDVIASVRRQGDRLILLALRLHDLEPDNKSGAYPGYKRMAAFTGLTEGYVRNRLSALQKGVIHGQRIGRRTHYFIKHVTPEGETPNVTPRDDMSLPEVTHEMSSPEVTQDPRHVTYMSPPEVQGKGNSKNYSTDFEEFWDTYPRRKNNPKISTLHAWSARIQEGVSSRDMIRAAKHYAAERSGKDPQFTLQAKTFLGSNRRFEEWLSEVSTATGAEDYFNPDQVVQWEKEVVSG